ncbi:DNA helicase RecQ [Fuchsiella alkaliacetigena]|uniref:DNA helicase RecQ n=1 Tax=Fuchsiella alkaliacetigena TaxID=957042 RepID=UPI00200B39DB|nr:DNA helicase RecQ [Fuchsiella alkaliacetigena]MCK8824042.1 DNA helicase RecQ [Fuchsiella alkaliacetigena]
MGEAEQVLQEYFGYENFRPGQQEIIDNILSGNNTLGIMPTGGGKSVCFQIPAVCLTGVTIVFSPLISLMKDQVDSLKAVGIESTFINSSLTKSELKKRINQVRTGYYDLIYIAPERLRSRRFIELLDTIEVSLVVVDEAHCISQWGHDFRPAYLLIADFLDRLANKPVLAAFTATATEDVREDISEILAIQNSDIFITSFDRENLTFKLITGEDKRDFIEEYVNTNRDEAGIIYAATRKEVDNLYLFLKNKGLVVGKYHAGLSDAVRKKTQDDFVHDRIDVVVATNAFGMGIDKSNVRYVLHHNMPRDIESYYQEAGRAGRDGERSEVVLLFSPADIRLPKYFIEESDLSANRKKLAYQKLQQMIDYCYTDRCLRAYILDYFGEEDIIEECDNCSNCAEGQELVDITVKAQKILSCIYRMKERYGIGKVAKVLRGSKSKGILRLGLDELSTYGIMTDHTIKEIKNFAKFLVAEGYIHLTEGKYSVAKLTDKAYSVLQGTEKVVQKVRKETEQISTDNELFDILRKLRKKIAEEEEVPPFVIFHDSTLQDMINLMPANEEEMLAVSGVGKVKLEKYAQRFLEEINSYAQEKDIDRAARKVQSKKKKKKKAVEQQKVKSHVKTYNLYQEGQSLAEIAELRELNIRTIRGHIIKAAQEGLAVDLEPFIKDQDRQIIRKAIKKVGTAKLRPIKDELPDRVSYFEIKVMIEIMDKKL